MAKAQGQRFNSLTVWLLVFVGLWLTATVFLVILYTGQEELRSEVTRCKNNNAKLITQSESKAIELTKSVRAGGPTVVGLIWAERGRLAELATGNPDDDSGAVAAKLDQLLQSIRNGGAVPRPELFEDTSYHDTLSMIYKEYQTQNGLWRDMQGRLAELDAEVNRLVQDNAQQKSDLDKRSKELTDQLVAAEAGRAKLREDSEAHVNQIEKQYEVRKQQSEQDLTLERQRSSELVSRLNRMQDRIKAFQARLGEQLAGPRKQATARHHDGLILKAVPGDDVVYINLGKGDRLVLDLEFAVYAQETGIPADGQARARIKVVSIYANSAMCEVVRLRPGSIISEGDLIANPVFDSRRLVNFVILGGFDLDRNGVVDPTGMASIEAMITHWGGQVLDTVDGLTDFVVVGAPPPAPRKGFDQSPEQTTRNRQLEKSRERYLSTLTWAETLSVPILSQEVFLNFLGYSGRVSRP